MEDNYSKAIEMKAVLLDSIDDRKERETARDRIDEIPMDKNITDDEIGLLMQSEIRKIYREILNSKCTRFSSLLEANRG